MGGWLLLGVITITIILGSFLIARDQLQVSCVVIEKVNEGGHSTEITNSVGGYYSAIDGVYMKRGYSIKFLPDFFEIMNLKRDLGTYHTIKFSSDSWSLFDKYGKDLLYKSSPRLMSEFLYQPPPSDWMSMSSTSNSRSISVDRCIGRLPDGATLITAGLSNLEKLTSRPVSTLIIVLIVSVAGYLYAYKIPVEDVSFSYATAIQGEYWRFITASLSHFELMHLFFNLTAFYEQGSLESVIGSAAFLYLNIDLILITMLICVASSYILITYFNREQFIYQQSIGFSCVLFAWMVVYSARNSQFCPVFFLPTMCVPTWNLAIPFTSLDLPINLGPFVILFVTKLILPRSSFLGHLSGILIGYPLAWGGINWLTPTILTSICTLALLFVDSLLVWTFPGYRSDADIASFVPLKQLSVWRSLFVSFLVFLFLSIPAILFLGWLSFFPRLTLLFLIYCAYEARRVEWLTDSAPHQDKCVALLRLALVLDVVMFLNDCAAVGALAGAFDLTSASVSFRLPVALHWSRIHLLLILSIEFAVLVLLVMCLQTIPRAKSFLQMLRLDARDVAEDMRAVGINDFRAFSGKMHVLEVYASPESAAAGLHLASEIKEGTIVERPQQPASAVI